MSELLEAIECLNANGLDKKDLCEQLLDNDSFEDNDDRKKIALCLHLDGDTEIDDCTWDTGCAFSNGKAEYLVLDEDEKESRWDDCLENYLDEGCVEGADSPYFDREKWKRDARMDGAGHALSSYDGSEDEVAEYFIFRTN